MDFMGRGRGMGMGMSVFVVDSVGSGVDKGVEGYCVERAGRDFLSVFVWTGLDWGDGGEKGIG